MDQFIKYCRVNRSNGRPLGTVTGMIGAFQVLQSSGMGGESSQKMAGNIGSALWTTAAGLVVAIPTLISYFIIKQNLERS